jgi:LmbE family N-acetylglucosaminyl deacetylase
VSTIVFFHAHPDDEASQTSGSMARASAEGHRVVVVFATNGEHGEVPDDLAQGETLIDRRRAEAMHSAEALGTARVEWLGYSDSGMTGWEQNAHTHAFHQANLTEAGLKLAAILDREDADVVVGYDWHGGYGHPDHVKVHHVLHAAARRGDQSESHLPEVDLVVGADRVALDALDLEVLGLADRRTCPRRSCSGPTRPWC